MKKTLLKQSITLAFLISSKLILAQGSNTTSYDNNNEGRDGDYSVMIGVGAGENSTSSADYNVFVGRRAGHNTVGDYNSFLGYYSGYANTSGLQNSFYGNRSGDSNTTGSYNTFLGAYAGQTNSTGSNNTYIGNGAGYSSTGSNNVFIGRQVGYSEKGSNKLYIDNSSVTSPLIWGDFSSNYVNINGKLGIGDSSPGNTLDVNGGIDIANNLRHKGDTDTYLGFTTNNINFYTGGTNRMSITSSGYVDIVSHLRHKGDENTYLLFGTDDIDFWTGGVQRLSLSNSLVQVHEALQVDGTTTFNSIPQNNALTQIMVADNSGVLHYRDVSTIAGGLQDISTDNTPGNISISSGSTIALNVDDADADPINEIQDLQLLGNDLSITNNAGATSIDLSTYLDNTDAQDLTLDGVTHILSLTNDATTIDLNPYLDNSDNQNLGFSGGILTISSGTGLDVSAWDLDASDDFDGQYSSLAGTPVNVSAFTNDAGYITVETDDQTALEVTYDNLTSGLTAGTVQEAIDELSTGIHWQESSPGEFTIASGKVGINTTSIPMDYELAVEGDIIAEEINILLRADWPDYVFAADYDLKSLEETEEFIQENSHLPNIPSAQEVKNKGVNLGEMNAALLRKIEELTLHLIDQNKQIESLSQRVNELESK